MTKNEIICRINRALTSKRERLCTSRGVNVIEDLGEHYTIDLAADVIAETHVDVVELARCLGLLGVGEEVGS